MAGINVGGTQTISGITKQQGEYKGHGVGAQSQGSAGSPTPLPVPVFPESLAVAPAATPAPWWFYGQYYNYGTSGILGDTKQDGTFKGHGTGASIQGGFTASGDIK